MKYNWKKSDQDRQSFEVYIYDQKLKLIYNGSYGPEEQKQLQRKINQCSLLFNINNAGYFIRNV